MSGLIPRARIVSIEVYMVLTVVLRGPDFETKVGQKERR